MFNKVKIGLSVMIALGMMLGVIAPVFAQTTTPPAAGGNGMPPQGGTPWISQIAEVLSMTVDELQSAISGGQTIEALATAKSISLDTLITTLVKSATERYTQEVADGRLTQTEADTRLSEIKTALKEWFTTGKMPDSLNMGRPVSPELQDVADVLDMTVSELQDALKNGKTIAELVTAKSLTLDTFISSVISLRTAELAKLVTAGKMTQAEADKVIADLTTTLTAWYNGGDFPAAWQQRGGGARVSKEDVAQALGMTADELDSALKAGKTITDLAAAQSMTIDALATTLLATLSEQLASDVTAGKLTQTQADEQLAAMKADLIKMLESGSLDTGRGPDGAPGGAPGGAQGGGPNGGGAGGSGGPGRGNPPASGSGSTNS